MSGQPDEADDLLAAELAFGLLDEEERAAAQARLDADPLLRERLAAWERLAVELLGVEIDPPRPSLWSEIAAALPGNDNAPERANPVARWRAASISLGVLAAIFGVLALRPSERSPVPAPEVRRQAPPPLVAVLRAHGEAAAVAVGFDPASQRLTLAADALQTGRGSAELWAIPADGTPRSLGLIDAVAPAWRLSPEAARSIAPGVTLAVTLEPRGGSPTGKPSGTPLLTGVIAVAAREDARPSPGA